MATDIYRTVHKPLHTITHPKADPYTQVSFVVRPGERASLAHTQPNSGAWPLMPQKKKKRRRARKRNRERHCHP